MNRQAGFLTFLAILGLVSTARAQGPAAADLLRLVPDDMGVCLVVHDLRGYADKFQKSTWYKVLKDSPLGKSLSNAKELQPLAKFEELLSKRLDMTWPQLRDDIFGDTVVLAYRGGAKADDEQGLFLVKARDAKTLAHFIDRINQEQKKSKELTELVELKHQGESYFRRVDKNNTHFYYVKGVFLFLTAKEDLLRRILDFQADAKKTGPIAKHLERAGAGKALVSLWINPRSLDAELQLKTKNAAGPEAYGLQKFLAIWQALDAVVLTFTPDRELELTLSLQARGQELPDIAKRFFNQTAKPSELWQRFPADTVLTVAGRFDSLALLDVLAEFTPPAVRKEMSVGLGKSIGPVLGLDLLKDVAPNIGPDWGFCLATAPNPKDYPHLLAALAIRPGDNKEKPVDKALIKGLDFLANLVLGVFSLKTEMQDKVEVHYLSHDKIFPPGLQPAYALKDGYLVLASCPEAIRRFVKSEIPIPAAKDTPIVRLSLVELSKLLKEHKEAISTFVATKNQIPDKQAAAWLDGLLALLAPFDHLALSHRAEAGQITWFLRLGSAKTGK